MLYPLSPLYSVSSCWHSHSQAVCGMDISSSTSTVSCVNFSPSTLCLFNVFASDVLVRFKSVGGVFHDVFAYMILVPIVFDIFFIDYDCSQLVFIFAGFFEFIQCL